MSVENLAGKGQPGGRLPSSGSPRVTRSRPSYIADPVKAMFYLADHGIKIECQVNPNQLKRIESAEYASMTAPGSAGYDYQYTGGGERRITVKCVLDALGKTPEEDGVLRELSAMELMTYPAGEDGLLDSQFVGPGLILFAYGQRVWQVVVRSINILEKIHDHLLNPIYAEVQVDMAIDLLYSDVNQALHSQRVSWAIG